MIYSLLKKGEINSYTVGRKVRFSEEDVQEYIGRSKKGKSAETNHITPSTSIDLSGQGTKGSCFIICGQDLIHG